MGLMTNGAGLSDTLVLKAAVTSEGCDTSLLWKGYHAASHHCNFIVVVTSDNEGVLNYHLLLKLDF